jgi:phospholipid/cholesterol/gamma-HCH transport system ATP-binding protein
MEALESVGLHEALEKYPSELSGGMRRRVAIARAAVSKPPLMLYDSPTGGLDPITAFRIMSLVIRQRDTRNTTSIVVTYRFQDGYLLANYRSGPEPGRLVRAAVLNTRFLILREGRIVFEGSAAEFRSSSDPYVAKFARRETPVRGRRREDPRGIRA